MPFDGTDYPKPHRAEPPISDDMITFLIIAISVLLLITPISMAALADICHALEH